MVLDSRLIRAPGVVGMTARSPRVDGANSTPLDEAMDDLGRALRGEPPAEGWWLASDGEWYPPELHPDFEDRWLTVAYVALLTIAAIAATPAVYESTGS